MCFQCLKSTVVGILAVFFLSYSLVIHMGLLWDLSEIQHTPIGLIRSELGTIVTHQCNLESAELFPN